MECPVCGASAPGGVEFCPSCLTSMSGGGSLAPVAVPAEPSSVAREELAVGAGVQACVDHPTRPAADACDRCGRWWCEECEPGMRGTRKVVCRHCTRKQEIDEAPRRIKRIALELCFCFCATGILIIVASRMIPPELLVLKGAGDYGRDVYLDPDRVFTWSIWAGLPFLIVGVLVPLTRSPILAWIGAGLLVVISGLVIYSMIVTGIVQGLLYLILAAYVLFRCFDFQSTRKQVHF